MRDINSMRGRNFLAPKQAYIIIHYHVQLGISDKDRAIKGLVVFNSWDLASLDLLNGLALGSY